MFLKQPPIIIDGARTAVLRFVVQIELNCLRVVQGLRANTAERELRKHAFCFVVRLREGNNREAADGDAACVVFEDERLRHALRDATPNARKFAIPIDKLSTKRRLDIPNDTIV